MNISSIISIIICLILSIGALALCYFQFKERGFLFNNAYIWASQEERKKMDENKESKRVHYRQSGFIFLLIGITFFVFALYIALEWKWLFVSFWISMVVTIVYAIISSIKIFMRYER